MLQGAEEGMEKLNDGTARRIVILKQTGEVVLSASGGTCRPCRL